MSEGSISGERSLTALAARQRSFLNNERIAAALAILIVAVATGILAGYLLRNDIEQAKGIYKTVRDDYNHTGAPVLNNNDFPAFYAGAEASVEERGDIYNDEAQLQRILNIKRVDLNNPPRDFSTAPDDLAWYRYYNPPLFLAAVSPLTLLDLRTAYLVTVGVNVALLGALMVALGFVLRWRQPHTLLLLLALAGYNPVAVAIHHGQPTLLIALLICLGYIAWRSGRTAASGVLLSLTGMKPHVLVALLPALRAQRRLLIPFFASCVALLALPFVFYGPGVVIDYIRLLTERGSGDVGSENFTTAVLSWSGFFRALTGEPQPALWLAGALATFAVLVVSLWRAEFRIALAAGVIATLLIVPHSHPQDWVLVAPIAAVLLDRRWTPLALTGVSCVLIAIYLGANDWRQAEASLDHNGHAVYWATVAGFALLIWLAAVVHVPYLNADAASEETASV